GKHTAFQKPLSIGMLRRREDRFSLALQTLIVGAGLSQKLTLSIRLQLDRGSENLIQALPLIGICAFRACAHRLSCFSVSVLKSQPRANAHSRSTEAVEILVTSAISSIVSPPKNFISTISLLSLSMVSSRSSASLRASKSSGASSKTTATSSSGTLLIPPPRF